MSADPAPARIDYDEVDFDDDLALVDGRPFTGIIFGLDGDGRLRSESHYRDGLPDGPSEEWTPDGRLERRWIAIRGNGASEAWEWHGNGRMRSYRRFVDRYAVETKIWDEEGTLLSEEHRPPLAREPREPS